MVLEGIRRSADMLSGIKSDKTKNKLAFGLN